MAQGLPNLLPPFQPFFRSVSVKQHLQPKSNRTSELAESDSPAKISPNDSSANVAEEGDANRKSKDSVEKSQKKPKLSKSAKWTIKITIISFVLSIVFSFISEITSDKAHISIAFILLILLIVISIIADAVGVATTSCDLAPLLAMASRKVRGSKNAIILVKNAERVSNICCDVIGDICGIVSGACTVAIVLKLFADGATNYWVTIIFSSVVAALTVGGKAVMKGVAVKNSKELVMFTARLIGIFYRPK